MGYKLTTAKFIDKARVVHGDKYRYEHTIYTHSMEDVIVTCNIHGDFVQKAYTHLRGSGCMRCTGLERHSSETWVATAKEIHGDTFDYSLVDYINNNTPVHIICKQHGVFSQLPRLHTSGHGCRACSLLAVGRVMHDTESYIKSAREVHGDTYIYDKVVFTKSNSTVKITCKKHGDFDQFASLHLSGGGCAKCSYIKNRVSREDFLLRSSKTHNSKFIYNLTNYNILQDMVGIVCPIHRYSEVSAHKHLEGSGCRKCTTGGYDVALPATFYVYSFSGYYGFGITNNFTVRSAAHAKSFKKVGVVSELVKTYEGSGQYILDMETHLKRTLPIYNTGVEGFKTEAVLEEDGILLFRAIEEFKESYVY